MSAVNGYIGRAPADSNVVIASQTYAPSTSTSTFTFAAGYQVGYIEAYVNGLKLIPATEFQATNTTTVTLTSAITNGDTLELVAYKVFNLGNPVDSVPDNFSVGKNLTVGGDITGGDTGSEGLILTAPNGNKFRVTVTNGGALDILPV